MTLHRYGMAVALAGAVAVGAGEASAGEARDVCAKPPPNIPSAIGFQTDNDMFGSGLDRHYTNGLQIYGVVGSEHIFDWVEDSMNSVPGVDACDPRVFVLTLGQHMYTPDDKAREIPDPQDRPYAGWLYLSLSGSVDDRENDQLHDMALDVGVVGPASGAGPIQNRWHTVIQSPRVRGWGHQLKNEPGVVLTYQNRHRRDAPERLFGLEVDGTRTWGVALGNVFSHASVGASVRIGKGLDLTHGAPFLRPSMPSAGLVRRDNDGFGLNLFAGVEGRAVARNIFLDGNTFRGGPSVNKKPLVGDLQLGVEVIYKSFRVAFTQIWRSREFDSQDSADQFGSLSVSYQF